MRSDDVVLQRPLENVDAALHLVAVRHALFHKHSELVLHLLQVVGLDEELEDLAPQLHRQSQVVH